MTSTEGAFLRLCRSISTEAVEQLAVAALRRAIVAGLMADAEEALCCRTSRTQAARSEL